MSTSNINGSLYIAGKNSNETYTISVPSNLLGFCRYDFSRFMKESNDLCVKCLKTGEYPVEKIAALRNSISGCHKYYENNVRSTFDKIVLDCWIEYICRVNELSTAALWDTFMGCNTPLERAFFQRLTEYRTHRAINQWINLLKIQEYAKKKIDFVFGHKLRSVEEASVRLNFFDLMFSVAANEQGYSLEAIGSVKFCRPGRLINAPFVYNGVSKEIVKNLFKDVQFADSLPYAAKEEGAMSDWEAMDAFAVIKNYLPEYSDSVANIILKSMSKFPDTVYTPTSFKAMIDLEIDAIIGMEGYLQKCANCGQYYMRSKYYDYDYCDTVQKNEGMTCRELMEMDQPEPMSEEDFLKFKEKAELLYREMADKVNIEISQRDFSEWAGNYNVILNNVMSGHATESDFEDFVEYSHQLANQKMSRAKQSVLTATQEEMTRPDGTKVQVKPYQFARIDRKELEKQGLLKPAKEKEESLPPITPREKQEASAPPVARIIRGAQPTSYHQIPLTDSEQSKEIPIKSDVFVGEDFSKEQDNSSAASERSYSPQADQKETKEYSGFKEYPDSSAYTQSGNPSHDNSRLIKTGEIAESSDPHFPELSDYPEQYSEQGGYDESDEEKPASADKIKELEKVLQESAERISRKSPQNNPTVSQKQHFEQAELEAEEEYGEEADTAYEAPDKARHLKEEEADNAHNRHVTPQIKLPELDKTKKHRDSFFDLGSGRIPNSESSQSDFIDERDVKEEKELKESESQSYSDSYEPDIQGKQSPNPQAQQAEKTISQGRAAKVAGAYRSVAEMAETGESDKSASDKEKSSAADDFAKILSSIERSDGFDEETIPLDAEGVPLSHKTKHVMDAIMKNSGVSPSLIYGRRQAAEKNVIIDEEFRDKKKKKEDG